MEQMYEIPACHASQGVAGRRKLRKYENERNKKLKAYEAYKAYNAYEAKIKKKLETGN